MNKRLLGPLGKDTVKLVLDQLSPQDQWHLATASGSIYRLFGQPAQKNIVYSFSIIPEGALEHPLFSKYPPNYVALIKFLRIRARNQKFIASEFPFFDYEDVWPLMAIMGNEEALRELIGEDPKRKDYNRKCVLDYLAFCGHTTVLINWIRDYYPDFDPRQAPSLHYFAALGGSEEVVFMLKDDYGYDINDSGGKKGWDIYESPVTLLHPALWGKHVALIRRLIDAKVDLHKSYTFQDGLAITAAEMNLWEFHEEFFALETKVESADFNNNLYLFYEAAVCSNRRDKLEEFRTKRADLDTGDYYHEPAGNFEGLGEHLGHAAIRSGQIEMLDWCIEQGWVDIKGVFSSTRRPVKQEDKDPALFVAAIHGQLKMFDHLVRKYGLDPHALFKNSSVLDWMIVRTTWEDFIYIANKYFPNQVHTTTDDCDDLLDCIPLPDAIADGVLYNAQQYIKRYCDDNFLCVFGSELLSLADDSKQDVVAKWLKNKIASLNPTATQTDRVEEIYSDENQFGI